MLTYEEAVAILKKELGEPLASAARSSLPPGIEIIRDKDQALRLSDLVEPDEDVPQDQTGDEDELTPGELWVETLEEVAGELGFELSEATGSTADAIRVTDFVPEVMELFHDPLATLGLGDFRDTVYQYCTIMLYVRSLEKADGGLGEKLIASIAAGGLPCGITGPLPEGKLVVYWPHAIEPPVSAA